MTNDYDMPMSPRREGTAVGGTDTTSGATATEQEMVVVRPMGLIELRDRAGTMVGDITRTESGLTVYSAKLKEVDSDNMRDFKHPVNVPWSSVLYWSVRKGRDNE